MALRSLSYPLSNRLFPRLWHTSEFLSLSVAGRYSHAFLRPIAVSLNLPGILSDLWDSVLRAVPKKKTSHMKKRHRQMAGKALKDVKNLNTCSGCGQVKRAHTLCPHCVESIKKQWKSSQPA